MLTRDFILASLRAKKPELQQKFPLTSLGLFGSYARNQQSEESDIDLVVEFSEPVGIEFVDLVLYLEDLFQKPVDLVTKRAINPTLKPFIERDLIYV